MVIYNTHNTQVTVRIMQVVHILQRYGTSMDDVWFDICIDLLPSDKADLLKEIIEVYDRLGTPLKRHILVTPNSYDEEEIDLVKLHDLDEFSEYKPPLDESIVVVGRYVIEMM